jgi:KDO2-lipid IV(A) lauroyltransferase
MKIFIYFIQFIIVLSLFATFKIIGLRNASFVGSSLAKTLGPLLRSKRTIEKNLKICFKNIDQKEIKRISLGMWDNIGRTFSEYIFLNNFQKHHENLIKLNGMEYLDEIKNNNKPVVFVSGHLSNFELLGTKLNQHGIRFCAIYRPLNNIFLNPIMEYLRLKYVCPVMIKKGRSNIRELLNKIKSGYSVIIIADQRTGEGKKIEFFNCPALTTTIPAQISLKYNCKIVPLRMERLSHNNFEMTIYKPFEYKKSDNYEKDSYNLTLEINKRLEKMILKKPEQWLWPHNRWK